MAIVIPSIMTRYMLSTANANKVMQEFVSLHLNVRIAFLMIAGNELISARSSCLAAAAEYVECYTRANDAREASTGLQHGNCLGR
jgi:hypothetical protein